MSCGAFYLDSEVRTGLTQWNGMGLCAARPLPHLGASPRQLNNQRRLASTLTSEAEAGVLQDQKKPLFDKILIPNR